MHKPDYTSISVKYTKENDNIANTSTNLKSIYEINQLIIERKLFSPQQKILIAVSGGQDSMLLLSILYRLRIAWNWQLAIIHFDHKWDNNSSYPAMQMYRISYKMKLKYYLSIPASIVKTEEKARNWRYKLMSRISNSHNYTSIATGHTASDRIETLLHNSIRGSGLDGLQSLSWKRVLNTKGVLDQQVFKKSEKNLSRGIHLYWFYHKIQFTNIYLNVELVRPLLNITRKQVQEETDVWDIPKCSDPTNKTMNIRRNRIRHQLLPYLRKYFNPKIDNVLSNLAEIVHSDLFYLDTIVLNIYNINSIINNSYIDKNSRSVDINLIQSYPIAIQRRILKKIFDFYTKNALSFQHIEQIRFLILNPYIKQNKKNLYSESNYKRPKHIFLPSKIELWIINNQLIIKLNR